MVALKRVSWESYSIASRSRSDSDESATFAVNDPTLTKEPNAPSPIIRRFPTITTTIKKKDLNDNLLPLCMSPPPAKNRELLKFVFVAKQLPNFWSILFSLCLLLSLVLYWHLESSLSQVLSETESFLEEHQNTQYLLLTASKDARMVFREVGAAIANAQQPSSS
jgi:hypothetical protein